jgi:hypothetical protein
VIGACGLPRERRPRKTIASRGEEHPPGLLLAGRPGRCGVGRPAPAPSRQQFTSAGMLPAERRNPYFLGCGY